MVDTVEFDSFALRSFEEPYLENVEAGKLPLGTKLRVSPSSFMVYVRSQFKSNDQLKDGYAPFCKHLFIPNCYEVVTGAVELTEELKPKVRTAYEARRPEELAVLSRWVEMEGSRKAKYIDCILYSYDQVVKEYEAMGQGGEALPQVDWFLISLKFQMEADETPMLPITIMRNALISEGGSGVEINKDEYRKSVEYWSTHIEVKAGKVE